MKIALWMILLFFAATVYDASADSSSIMAAQDQKKLEASSGDQSSVQGKKSASGIEMPVYKPPLRGAPAGRVGGGTRGAGDEIAYVLVLAPDHIGLTTQQQPSLYWFLSAPTAFPVEFTLIETRALKPLIETRLSLSGPGIQRIRLADYEINLQDKVLYQWFVTLIPDLERRSKDVLSGGFIQRSEASDELRQNLRRGGEKKAPYIYAEAGFWYDAFIVVCDMIKRFPDDAHLQNMRASLLKQVGLGQVTKDLE